MTSIKKFAQDNKVAIKIAGITVYIPIAIIFLIFGGIWKFTDKDALYASCSIASVQSVEEVSRSVEDAVDKLSLDIGDVSLRLSSMENVLAESSNRQLLILTSIALQSNKFTEREKQDMVHNVFVAKKIGIDSLGIVVTDRLSRP